MDNQQLEHLRHSCAHLLAAAVLKLYPETKNTIGPAIDNGFYYDFEFSKPITEEDLVKIEAKMQDLLPDWTEFTHKEVSVEEAKEFFKDNPYKQELIDEISQKGETITLYTAGNFTDLCRGGHCENPNKDITAFKLLSLAGAYWKGSEKNKMLTRIYGTAFPTQQELEKHLEQLEEAKKRDHRKLGKELELFTFSEDVGPGLFIWLPNGATIKREIEEFQREIQIKQGYKHVTSPHIGKKQLWVQSGHWDLYREKMYSPMTIDKVEYLVKPMSCPMHIQVYKSKPRSYRGLPLRIAEVASVYRYEQSGELSGLARVRYFNQDDAHIFCTKEDVETEVLGVLDLIKQLYSACGLTQMEFWLTLRAEEKKDKYLGNDEVWNTAEAALQSALESRKLEFTKAPGEAKFYGPSIDIMVKDSIGRKWQCGTIQVDFSLPERFELEYIGADGKAHRPVMVHRAPLGSLERFISILIEHFGGAFPTWMAPIQVMIVPITDENHEYAQKVLEHLNDADIRAEIDSRPEKMQAKIRDASMQKIPYIFVVGKREAEAGAIAVRTRKGEDLGAQPLDQAIAKLQQEIETRSNI